MRDFDRSLPMLMHRALNAVLPRFRTIFRSFGLTERQWRVLRVLWEADGAPLLALAARTLIPAPSLVGVVDRLQRDGLVERRRSETDRRLAQVWLSDAGRGLEQTVTPLVDAAYAELENLVSAAEWQALTATLNKIAIQAADQGRQEVHEQDGLLQDRSSRPQSRGGKSQETPGRDYLFQGRSSRSQGRDGKPQEAPGRDGLPQGRYDRPKGRDGKPHEVHEPDVLLQGRSGRPQSRDGGPQEALGRDDLRQDSGQQTTGDPP